MEARIVSRLTGIPERKLEQIKSIPRPKHGPYTPQIVASITAMSLSTGMSMGAIYALASLSSLHFFEALTLLSFSIMIFGFTALFFAWKAKRAQYKEHYKMYLMLKEEAA